MNTGKAQWTINYPLLYTFPCEIMFFGNLMKREKSANAPYQENSSHGMDKLLNNWFCFLSVSFNKSKHPDININKKKTKTSTQKMFLKSTHIQFTQTNIHT